MQEMYIPDTRRGGYHPPAYLHVIFRADNICPYDVTNNIHLILQIGEEHRFLPYIFCFINYRVSLSTNYKLTKSKILILTVGDGAVHRFKFFSN